MDAVNDLPRTNTPRMVAVVVLYRVPAQESITLQTLRDARANSPDTATALEVVVWDNTPGERTAPADGVAHFWHDPSNPGLAAAYNNALQYARERGAAWLVTLDQDTHITPEYLEELLAATQHTAAAAVLPRLMWNGRLLSPFRPRTQGPALPLEGSLTGETRKYLQAFNSGAAFSVLALTQVGGFDRNFPLDYLDHSTFARLHRNGASLYLLRATLEHALSSQTPGPLHPSALERERSVLAAERRFVRMHGTPAEQRMYPVRMLRRVASVLVHRRDLRLATLIMRTLAGANR